MDIKVGFLISFDYCYEYFEENHYGHFDQGMDPYPVGMDPYQVGMVPYPVGTDPYPVGMDPYLVS